MIVSIHQPNYIPWAGYFHKIARSDIFVILDDVQFPKGTIANRNSIKGSDGQEMVLTVPVFQSKGAYQNYNEIGIDYTSKWNTKHLARIKNTYARAPHAKTYLPALENILLKEYETLSDLNSAFIIWILSILEIDTRIVYASSIKEDLGTKNDRNINICLHLGADTYLSGNGARKYNDENMYKDSGLNLIYTRYESEPYPQLYNTYLPNLSIIDMLFNVGKDETRTRVICPQVTYP